MNNQCEHEGQLRDQCVDCIRKGFPIEMRSRAFDLTDDQCKLISSLINDFCDRDESFYNTSFRSESDLIGKINDAFATDQRKIVIEFIEIYLFG